jgi:hypothetical protein
MMQPFTPGELREIARKQSLLLWSILAGMFSQPATLALPKEIGVPIYFAIIGLQIYALYALARALRSSPFRMGLLAICVFIPILGVCLLITLNQEATKTLRKAGIKVGFMGANPNDIPSS